ncbi:MAG: glycerol kinase [Desulfobacteraceae bacterium]|nr:glycerol kinase [Desulfobacteraceae bacterium]
MTATHGTNVIAVDQGTTGTKAFRLSGDGGFTKIHSSTHRQFYPHPGWVEHDPEELYTHVARAIDAGSQGGAASGVGLANQGETVVAWHARTKKPVYNAIVWQDQRTADSIEHLRADGAETLTLERAGLPLDAYYSATKIRWILDNVPASRSLLDKGLLRAGTSDAFFLDRLTGVHATDVTTASRTSLMNLYTLTWDEDLCRLFGIPVEILPEIKSTTDDFGVLGSGFARMPLTASITDQQAALFGHHCVHQGDAKITFGTGAFALVNTGSKPIFYPDTGIGATVAWRLGKQPAVYAMDGALFNAASAVDWVKRLGLFSELAELDTLASPMACEKGVYFVPALSGLACPHWDRRAAGLWIGMDLDTRRRDMIKSVLEGVAFRTHELVHAISLPAKRPRSISIDGGLAGNLYFCTVLANTLGMEIVVPDITDITGVGTALLALAGTGFADRVEMLPGVWRPRHRFQPETDMSRYQNCFHTAVTRAKKWRQS